jgi:hypothetical protein
MAKLSVEEPDALMHARPGPWEPWRVTARATQPGADSPNCDTRGGVSGEWHLDLKEIRHNGEHEQAPAFASLRHLTLQRTLFPLRDTAS